MEYFSESEQILIKNMICNYSATAQNTCCFERKNVIQVWANPSAKLIFHGFANGNYSSTEWLPWFVKICFLKMFQRTVSNHIWVLDNRITNMHKSFKTTLSVAELTITYSPIFCKRNEQTLPTIHIGCYCSGVPRKQ